MEELINTLKTEVPRIISNSEGDENDTNVTQDVLSVVQAMENGEEPLLLKLVTGTATQQEREQWCDENNIPYTESDDVLNMLMSSFLTGTEMARSIEDSIANQADEITEINDFINDKNNGTTDTFNRDKILSQLDNIMTKLDNIKSEVKFLIDTMSLSEQQLPVFDYDTSFC